jgi:AbiV family abortive infection protein
MTDLKAALVACVANARDLVESAESVHAIGRYHIAYHLAALSLEELGKRELLQIQDLSAQYIEMTPLPAKAMEDHSRKIFWCLFSLNRITDKSDQSKFFELLEFAKTVHQNRLASLYVNVDTESFVLSSKTITQEQSLSLVELARACLSAVELQVPREKIPKEELELQAWFVSISSDPERRKLVFNASSLAKLRELDDVQGWAKWLKAKIEQDEEHLRSLVQQEMERGLNPSTSADANRWKIQIRIETHSHTIRSSIFRKWNESVDWIKFEAVQGAKKKSELIVHITLSGAIPMHAIWDHGFSLARHLIVALNLATSGFWWWVLPRQKSRYYEKITDLKNGLELKIDQPNSNIFPNRRPALTEKHIYLLTQCFAALPTPRESDRTAYGFYLGGLTYLSLSDVHLRFEDQAFFNFFLCLKGMIHECAYSSEGETATKKIEKYLREKYPDLDQLELDRFLKIVATFDAAGDTALNIDSPSVYLIKLLCETFFREETVPFILQKRKVHASSSS